ncbi:MAG: hypothetical protein CME60_08115 [Halobacteriovoraceae bacterium]|nr:hypothetical protein [Halobacteriovoraceae bacterium]
MFISKKIKALALLTLFSLLSLSQGAYAQNYVWKSLFISGDHSIDNFDVGRLDLAEMFDGYGIRKENQIHLTSSQKFIEQAHGVANLANIQTAFESFKLEDDGACFVHMTSHGIKGGGFYLSRSQALQPRFLSKLVNENCGDRPSVILISACYSGQFITDQLAGDNRIILTAAIKDRPSFGCSPDYKYTFWDSCLLEEVPNSRTWNEAYKNIQSCITRKENELGARASLPQGYFGKNMIDFPIY